MKPLSAIGRLAFVAVLLHRHAVLSAFMDVPAVGQDDEDVLEFDADFTRLVNDVNFIDKTVFIRNLIERGEFMRMYISHPRGFGKSTMLDMTKRFLDMEFDKTTGAPRNYTETAAYRLFANATLNLRIRGEHCERFSPDDNIFIDKPRNLTCIEESLGKHWVVSMSFRRVVGPTPELIIRQISDVIYRLFVRYKWIYDLRKSNSSHLPFRFNVYLDDRKIGYYEKMLERKGNATDVQEGATFIIQMMAHFTLRKGFLFVDDYDQPFLIGLNQEKVFRKVYNFVDGIFNPILELPPPYGKIQALWSVLMMGRSLLSLALSSMESYMVTLKKYSFGSNSIYTEDLGFTVADVETLFNRHHIPYDERRNVRQYYGGYMYRDELFHVYYPSDILSYLKHRQIREYQSRLNVTYRIAKNLQTRRIREKMLMLLYLEEPWLSLHYEITYENLESFFRPYRELFKDEINNRNREHNMLIMNLFFTYLHENGIVTCWAKKPHEKFPPDINFEIPNRRTRQLLERMLEQHYIDNYNVYFTKTALAKHLDDILRHENTTETMLNGIRDTLRQLYANATAKKYHEFDFVFDLRELHTIFATTAYYNFRHVNVTVPGLLLGQTYKSDQDKSDNSSGLFHNYERNRYDIDMILYNDDHTTLLMVKLTFDEYADRAIKEFLQYTPRRVRHTVKLMKYLLVNMDLDYDMQVVAGPNNYTSFDSYFFEW